MQFSAKFSVLALNLFVAVLGVTAAPQPDVPITPREMAHWLATTDAQPTYVGTPVNPLTVRSAQIVSITYCDRRVGNTCGGSCTDYAGEPRCLNAPNTECIEIHNVGDVLFCDRPGCTGSCHQFSTCGKRLDPGNNFCWTPGTKSIQVL